MPPGEIDTVLDEPEVVIPFVPWMVSEFTAGTAVPLSVTKEVGIDGDEEVEFISPD